MKFLLNRFSLFLFFVLAFIVTNAHISAQAPLQYGSGAFGSISAQAPLVIYTFQGQTNDLVSISVMGLSPDFQPTISLNNANGQQIATSINDPLSTGSGNVRLNAQLATNGFFTIIITNSNGTPGDFAIRLDGSTVDTIVDAIMEESSTNSVAASGALVFNVDADADSALIAVLTTTTSNYNFSANLQTQAGSTVATFSGSASQPVFITIPAGDATYKILVSSSASINGDIVFNLSTGVTQSPVELDASATPDATTEAQETATEVTEDVTQATEVTTQETPTTTATPTTVQQNEATATEAQQQLQPVDPTATQPQQQNTPTSTYTPTSTATSTPSYTPTATPTSTATYTPSYTPTTPPPPQVAPEDQRTYAMDIELDTTTSILEFVSYPGGDREDRVAYDVTGMNPNVAFSGGRARLVIAVSCFGQNTNQIEFFTLGQTYSCGQTLVDREVTFDSNNGSITITAIGGEGTYVQWVLTATATRIN